MTTGHTSALTLMQPLTKAPHWEMQWLSFRVTNSQRIHRCTKSTGPLTQSWPPVTPSKKPTCFAPARCAFYAVLPENSKAQISHDITDLMHSVEDDEMPLAESADRERKVPQGINRTIKQT